MTPVFIPTITAIAKTILKLHLVLRFFCKAAMVNFSRLYSRSMVDAPNNQSGQRGFQVTLTLTEASAVQSPLCLRRSNEFDDSQNPDVMTIIQKKAWCDIHVFNACSTRGISVRC